MSILKPYAPRYTNFSWGDITFDGLDEDFLTITPSANITTTQVGADGSRAPTINPNYTCVVSTAVKQTSIVNRKLTQVLNRQRANRTLYYYNFTVDDPSGSLLTLLKNAYFEEGPEQGYGMEVGSRIWTFNAELNYDELASGIDFATAIQDNIAAEVGAAIAAFIGSV